MELLFFLGSIVILVLAVVLYGNGQIQRENRVTEHHRAARESQMRAHIHANEISALAQIEQEAWAGNVPDAPLSPEQQSFEPPMNLMTYTVGSYDPTGIRKFQHDSIERTIKAWHKAHPEAGGE